MSAAPAATAEAAAPAKGGKKKLIIIIIAAVLLLVLVGGGAAMMLMKKKPAEGEEDGGEGGGHAKPKAEAHEAAPVKHAAHDPKHPPVFVPLDPFTVNLADKESERYAQVGITLEIADAHVGDEIKNYMPAIRNNILMVLSHKTAQQLLTREGKEKLSKSLLYASVRPLGYDIDDEEDEDEEAAAAETAKKKKKKKKAPPANLPVTAVHFSNFIVQ
jgi:flagellar FliL protein